MKSIYWVNLCWSVTILLTVHGKILVGEKIGESLAICQNFPRQYSQIHWNVFGIFISTDFKLIRQIFPMFYLYSLPKFSCVRYNMRFSVRMKISWTHTIAYYSDIFIITSPVLNNTVDDCWSRDAVTTLDALKNTQFLWYL